MNKSSNNAEKCRIWSNENGCNKYSKIEELELKVDEIVFDC